MVISDRADIVVIGGGPAGASTAIHLARSGVDVLLLDRAKFPREKSCAEYCSPGVVDALDDLGALERLRQHKHQMLPAMRVSTADHDIRLDFARDRPNGNLAMAIRRSVLDNELLQLASERGARVVEGARAIGPVVSDRRVTGIRFQNGNREGKIAAGLVVAADGLHSTFTRKTGIDRAARWPVRLGLVARYRVAEGSLLEGEMHVGEQVYCGLSPVADDELSVSLVVPMGSKPRGVPTVDFFEETINGLPGVARRLSGAERLTPVRGLGPLARKVKNVAGEGYLLVGDAAGFFDPLTGEGVHRALRGGELASEAALGALARSDRFPAGYAAARNAAFGDKERVCRVIQALILSSRVVSYAARRASERDEVKRLLCGVLGDYAPARNALNARFIWNLLRP